MEKIRLYISESYTELLTKVTWPTWRELQSSAIIVMVASVLISFLVFLMDSSFSWLLEKFYQMF